MKQIVKTSWVLVLILLVPGFHSLSAQSFLSRQRPAAELKLKPAEETDPGADQNAEGALNEHQETTDRPASGPAPETTETRKALVEDGDADQPLLIDEQIQSETGQESDDKVTEIVTLKRISDLIDGGEFGHARALLENLDPANFEELSEDDRFIHEEWRLFLLLKTRFLLGDYRQVVDMAPAYFESYSNGNHYFLAYFYFASALDQLKSPLQMVYLVTEDFFSNLSIRESQKLRSLLIDDALTKNQPLAAFSFMMDSDGQLLDGFDRKVSELIEIIEEIDDIEIILDEAPVEPVKSLAELRKVQLLIRDGEYQAAQDFLSLLSNSENVDAATLAELQGFQNYIDIALNTDPYRIGVILPLSHHRFGILARQALDGLELALQSRFPGDHPIQLIIKDSAEKPAAADGRRLSAKERSTLVQNQVRELVEEDRVIAILGPLAKNTSLAAGETAEFYKVPVISFSITEELGKEMPFLYRFQRNRIVEAENLAYYALDYLQAERFVLFFTEDKSGRGFRVMQAFNRIIVENGGQIAGISPIKYNQVDFKNNYLSLTGGFKKKVEAEEGKKKEDEEPVVDFDLMFAPVPLNTLKIMLDFNRSFDAEKVWVLSGAEINASENQLLNHTGRLRFIDAFPIGSTGTYLQPFYEEHWRSYNYRQNYRPPTSYTIYAYEALEMVAKLLNDPRHHNRESLRNAIQNLEGFPILTGRVNCDQNGELIKQLNILRIRAKKTIALF